MHEGRVPPYSSEAEKAVLGAILFNNEVLRSVMAHVKESHFYNEAHRRIYSMMLALKNQQTPIDHLTLGEALRDSGVLDKIGGVQALAGLTDAVSTVANIDYYSKIVAEKAARRAMIYAAQEVVSRGFMEHDETEEYLASSRQAVTLAAQYLSGVSKGPRHIDDDLYEIQKEILTGKKPEGVIKTGFRGIDYISGGLWPGFMHALAARPSMGKSLVAINIANNVSQRGEKVLYVTLEDTRKLSVYRMLARYAGLDLTDLTLGRLKESEQFACVTEAVVKLGGGKPLWVDDTAGLTSDAIVQICAAHMATEGLDLVIIDHLHEVTDKGESETVITTHAAQNFRNIAKDLNIPVLLVCQLNRALEARKDKRPTLADLRQSGAIEQVARVVWFLYRDGYYTGEQDRRDFEWHIAKANHGRTGIVKMWVNLAHMYACDWDVQQHGLWPSDDTDRYVSKHQQPDRGEVGLVDY